MNKTKLLSLTLALIMSASCFAGCKSKSDKENETEETSVSDSVEYTKITPEYENALNNALIMAIGSSMCYNNGVKTALGAPAPQKIDDVIFVPLEPVVLHSGGEYEWNEDTLTANVKLEDTSLEFTSDKNTFSKDGETETLSALGYAVGTDMMVPLGDICSVMNLDHIENDELIKISDDIEKYGRDVSPKQKNNIDYSLKNDLLCDEEIDEESLWPDTYEGRSDLSLKLYIDSTEIPYYAPKDFLISTIRGIYIENLVVTKSKKDGYFTVKMTVYNNTFAPGTLEVYDQNDGFISSEKIDPFNGLETSLIKGITNMFALGKEWINAAVKQDIDEVTYRSQFNGSKNEISLDVPGEGYIYITTNPTHSTYTAAYSVSNLIAQIICASGDVLSVFGTSTDLEAFKDAYTSAICDVLLNQVPSVEHLAMDIANAVKSENGSVFCLKNIHLCIADVISSYSISLEDICEEALKNLEDLNDTVFNGVFETMAPIIKPATLSWSLINDASNLTCTIADYVRSMSSQSLLMEIRDWRKAYADYLTENQEKPGHACYYEKGDGRFALEYMDGDNIPELIIIDIDGQTMPYTYYRGVVKAIAFAADNTDIFRFNLHEMKFNGGDTIVQKAQNGWKVYSATKDKRYDYVLSHWAFVKNGQHYFNEYIASRMINEGYEYASPWYGYIDNPVSASEYKHHLIANGLVEENYHGVDTAKIHKIIPSEIESVLLEKK